MVSSFHPHSMCKNVERVTAKTGCTSCTKRTISFEVSGFHTETRLLQMDFIFLNLFEFHSFSVFKMHHSKPHHQFSTLSDGEVFHFFVFGIRVGGHLYEDCHHLVDAPDNIAISIANKIMHYNKVDTQVIKVQSYGSSHHAES